MPHIAPGRTPVNGTGSEWSATVVQASPETAPTLATQGLDVSGYESGLLTLDATSITAATVKLYVYDDKGAAWVEDTDSAQALTTTDKVVRLDLTSVKRLAVRVTAVTGTSVTRSLTVA